LAPDSYPNFKTQDGKTLTNTIGIGYVPSGLVNREPGDMSIGWWEGNIYELSDDVTVCNIAGNVIVDEVTRNAKITVEIFYTSDSDFNLNYLTIAMTQDSVWGWQSNGEINPEQYFDGNYCHMHILRDIITPTWGETISPTKAGTLIRKTYNYEIPKIIGDPNGVKVNLDHLHFIAFVSDNTDYGISYPIQNVAQLSYLIGTQKAVFPYIDIITEKQESPCSNNKTFTLNMMNRGLDKLTSIKMLMEIDNGDTFEYEWNGSIASYETGKIEFDMEVPIGEHKIDFKIIEANGVAFNSSKTFISTNEDLTMLPLEGENDEITIEIMQDRNGHETTWQLIDDNDNIVASGGPYEYYFGQVEATELHTITVNVSADQCLKFVINDMVGNGICCDVGDGYYRIIDGYGNIVIDGDGNFGYQASHNLYSREGNAVQEMKSEESYNIYPNPAKETLTIEGKSIKQIVIYNAVGQMVEKINCDENIININIEAFPAGIYLVNIIDKKDSIITNKISITK
jgi:hypothetical protein